MNADKGRASLHHKLHKLAPEIFNVVKWSLVVKEKLSSPYIVQVAFLENGKLDKYVVRYDSSQRSYYLSKNTKYRMRNLEADMKYVYACMPKGSIPRVVLRDIESDAILCEEVGGRLILTIKEEKRIIFQRLGKRMQQFHAIPIRWKKAKRMRFDSQIENLLHTVNNDAFRIIKKRRPSICRRLESLAAILIPKEKSIMRSSPLVLNHGDLHLGNILVKGTGQVGLIDLTDIIIAPREKDIGGLFEQMYEMIVVEGIASAKKVQTYKQAFLEGYGRAVINMETIRFYEVWQAWRNALFFASKTKPNLTRAAAILGRVESIY